MVDLGAFPSTAAAVRWPTERPRCRLATAVVVALALLAGAVDALAQPPAADDSEDAAAADAASAAADDAARADQPSAPEPSTQPAWDDLDTLSPWMPKDQGRGEPSVGEPGQDASAGGPSRGTSAERVKRPEWGPSADPDTISPWSESELRRWGESDETVSPWDVGPVPAGREARFELGPARRSPRQPAMAPLVRHGIYNRPQLARLGDGSTAIAIGGYVDMVTAYLAQQGVSDGVTFEPRTLDVFITSRIANRVRVVADVAFEDGARRVAVQTAQIDVLFHRGLGLRGGILLVPLGKYNLAHDAPLYDVINRPLVATRVLPTVLAEPGLGLFGALGSPRGNRLTYDVVVVRGLDDGIITPTGTRLSAGRNVDDLASEDNGLPAIAGRFAFLSAARGGYYGEVGFSFYAGVYNDVEVEGIEVDEARWLRLLALDGELALGPVVLRSEVAYANVDLPPHLSNVHARAQLGFYSEATLTFLRQRLGPFERASLGAVVRGDYVDMNLDRRDGSGESIGEVTTRFTLGPSFRPAPWTALRLLYFHEWLNDSYGNPLRGGGLQLGLASYF